MLVLFGVCQAHNNKTSTLVHTCSDVHCLSLFVVSPNRCVPPPITPVLWPLPFGFSQSCRWKKTEMQHFLSFFSSTLVTTNDESALHLALGCFSHYNYLKTAYKAAGACLHCFTRPTVVFLMASVGRCSVMEPVIC